MCLWVSACVCVLLKLTCKSVLFRYPEINNKQNSKHFKLNQQKNLCACVKNNFLQISHKKKKRMSCIFIIFLLHFLCFFFVKCHSQLYLQPISAKECSLNCWNSVFVCFSSNNAWGTQQRKLISGGWGWLGVLNIYTMRILQTHRAVLGGGGIFTLSISIVFRTRISVSFLLFTFNGAHILFDFFLFLLHARQKRIHFCKVFPWVWILFLLFFCNFLGRDEPFNVFNCCNDLLHQVILLVFF